MHSSADKGMDLREPLGRPCSAGQEDFSAVLLDATASLPSLSPLSANPFKAYTGLDAVSDGLPAKGSYDQIGSEAFKPTTKNAQNPFLVGDDGGEVPEQKRSGVLPPGAEPFFLSEIKEPVDTTEKTDTQKFSPYQLDSSPDSPVELFVKRDNDASLEEKLDFEDLDPKVSLVDHAVKDDYVDFKPFDSSWASNEMSILKDISSNKVDEKSGSEISKDDAEKMKTLPAQKYFEKENESSNEEISSPSTPDASKEAYIACAKFESDVTSESITAKSPPLIQEQASENKTDEKKIAEMKAHFGTEPSSAQIELASSQGRKAESDKVENLLKETADAMANISEGLTPDIVQEAYESELHDVVSPKLAYESKIDLVQTSESSQEPLNVTGQLCPPFEGGPETAPSPVLPDIVMEAPLNASPAGVGGPAEQIETSPLETLTTTGDYENDYDSVLQKSEKPPTYQEAMNVSGNQAPEMKVEAVSKKPDSKNDAPLENSETSYISIACDLVKETKGSDECASPAFTDYSKMVIPEFVPHPVPEYTERAEKASLPSGISDTVSSQPGFGFGEKEEEAVQEKPLEATAKTAPKGVQEEVPPSLSKPYLESFQPPLEPSKNEPTSWFLEAEAAELPKKEKIPQLQMEEVDTYADDFSVSKELKEVDKMVVSIESSPETEDLPTVPYQAAKVVAGATEKVTLENSKIREPGDSVVKAEERQSPYQEVAQDLSLKNVHVKTEEQDLASGAVSEKPDKEMPEARKEPLPSADVSPLPMEQKLVSVGKEAERGFASVKEKEEPPPLFPSKLSKPSVVDLLYWRDVKKTGVVFGASLFLLLSLTVFSIVSVVAYIALALLSVTISFRIYKGVIQAVQKSDEGHPFRTYLDKDVAVSEELVQKYSNVVLGHFNSTVKELRRLFLVDDLVDSLKFAVLMWVFTYVGALFNGLTLLILALISLFSIPIIYEKYQAQIDHYVGFVNKNVKDAMTKIQAKIPGLKRKTE
ncbi:reticulon-4 isoform X2 [Pogona vitticeps]